MTSLIYILFGILAGALANILVDYLIAQRQYHDTLRSPFTTVKPEKPRRFPPALAPHSGLLALATGKRPAHFGRRLLLELGLAALFVYVVGAFPEAAFTPFYLGYAALFAMIAVVDIERRWVMPELIGAGLVLAIAEALIAQRLSLQACLGGALVGGLIFLAIYAGGLLFSQVRKAVAGRGGGRTVFGFGDVQVAVFCGAVLGQEAMAITTILMIQFAGVAALWVVIQRGRAGRKGRRKVAAIPYAPYMVLATAVMLYAPTLAIGILTLGRRLFG
jgi:Type IV leader peptidase family